MNQQQYDPADLSMAAEYALGLLDTDGNVAFEKAMSKDPMLRVAYTQMAVHFAAQEENVLPVTPPEDVFQNIDKAIFTQDLAEPSIFRHGWFMWTLLGAGLLGGGCLLLLGAI